VEGPAVNAFVFANELLTQDTSPLPWTGAPCSPQRTWAEKDGAQPLQGFCDFHPTYAEVTA